MKKNSNKACLFIRVSTQQQDYDRQILELTEYCESRNFTISKTIATKISGVKKYEERPDVQELFQAAKNKQFRKVVVTEISRIGRNARDIRNTISFLHDRGISIVFKNLGGLESLDENGNESFVTNIIIAIYSELAQEEKRILSERIKSGLICAKSKGKHIGRPDGTTMTKEDVLKKYPRLTADLKNGMSLIAAMKVHEVSKGTVIKVKKTIGKNLLGHKVAITNNVSQI
ncbi:MAG TPA: recombinase family protein [Bacteroidia bacterium]|jgi:DNA invertase Pin-like site-specific DNA recombinase|nr:recombinase family protein [Bacteroidia bacterium]